MDYKDLPKFDSPPVIETVLSAQFSPLSKLTDAHVGWYWKQYLDEMWDQVVRVPRIDDRFEKFGDERQWIERGLKFEEVGPSDRTQLIRSDGSRMIQIQNTRFIYNWRKQNSAEYPSYDKLLPEFKESFLGFEKFSYDAFGQAIELNQWEVTYVNHLPKGDLWGTASDMQKIFPAFGVLANQIDGQIFDTFNGTWQLTIDENKGRIYIDIKHARIGSSEGQEIIRLAITARGPINDEVDIYTGFDVGHKAIVCTFADITSPDYHKIWKRRQ